MKTRLGVWLVVCGLAVAPELLRAQKRGDVQVWLTNADKSALFEEQRPFLRLTKAASQEPAIEIDDQQRFQSIDGFGFALTGGARSIWRAWTRQRERRCYRSSLAWTARALGSAT
ncbi:MAG: hypothetical protein ACYDCG_11760 [Candidatus Acidiferrales bacterium]